MDVLIRVVTSREEAARFAARLQAWAVESARQTTGETLAPDTVQRILERRFGERETMVVIAWSAADETPIGGLLTLAQEEPLSGRREPLIAVLHVDAPYRHRGVARELVAAAVRELEKRGFARVLARAGHNDDALISMGERWGFVRHLELMMRE